MKLSTRGSWDGLLAVAALTVTAPAAHAQETLPLQSAVALPVADEDRTGYDRDLFNHWIDADRDGCSTRSEVLLEEATTTVTGRCPISGGEWYSW